MNVTKLFSGPFKRREAAARQSAPYMFGWGVPDQQRACALQQHPYFLYIFFFTLTKLAELPGSAVGSTRREAESASDSRKRC